ncbi:hypothetical protein [Streptomyces tremellae]|uniref:Uncharacterized protein n=1 Tax=Streptomyces tremellae TaxID=1124239 RepID=A0ABP7G376_9ACTN
MRATIIARQAPRASAEPEPEPQHDRSAPQPAPARPHPAIRAAATPEQRLDALLLRMVREQDARIPAERRVPRTRAEMQARLDAAGTGAGR